MFNCISKMFKKKRVPVETNAPQETNTLIECGMAWRHDIATKAMSQSGEEPWREVTIPITHDVIAIEDLGDEGWRCLILDADTHLFWGHRASWWAATYKFRRIPDGATITGYLSASSIWGAVTAAASDH